MSPLSDKDLDHLAREAAEQLDVDQNSSGWDSLEKLLDVEMPVEKRRRRWLFFLLFPLLGSVMFLAYKMNNAGKPSGIISVQTEKKTDNASTQPSELSGQSTAGNEKKSQVPVTTFPESNTQAGTQRTTSAPNSTSHTSSLLSTKALKTAEELSLADRLSAAPEESTSNSNVQVVKKPERRNVIRKNSNKPAPKQIAIIEMADPIQTNVTRKQQPANVNQQDNTSLDGKSSYVRDHEPTEPKTADASSSNEKPTAPLLTPTVASNAILDSVSTSAKDSVTLASKPVKAMAAAKNKRKTLMPDKGFGWGIIAGPDYSEVNRKGIDKAGINFGLQISYRIAGRFSIISGISYTHKFYTAQGADYFPPKPSGSFLDYVTLKKVVGDCFMYEMPLNVRFDAIASRKNYLYTSVGLSSYFMKKENYDFYYTDNNTGMYGSKYLSYKSDLKYWFKVLNLTVGYERMLKKRWSLQAEPYIKLPLKGLAFGRMQLNSYGLLLGVRYHTGTFKMR